MAESSTQADASARKLVQVVMQRLAKVKNQAVADAIGKDESTVTRRHQRSGQPVMGRPGMRTVAHEHLRASLRVVTCECHGQIAARCPSLVHRARLHEGRIPESYAPESFGLQDDYSAFDLIVWSVALSAALVTGYSLAGLFIQWVRG